MIFDRLFGKFGATDDAGGAAVAGSLPDSRKARAVAQFVKFARIESLPD